MMNFTPAERFAVVTALVEKAAAQRATHGGSLLDRLSMGEPFGLRPAEIEALAQRIEDEGEPNSDLLG